MDEKLKILAIIGTNSMFSKNKELLNYMKNRYDNHTEIELFELYNIGSYDEMKALQGLVPTRIKELQNKIIEADGVIFGITEFSNSMSSVLKGALEWLSATPFVLVNKKVMIVSDSFTHLDDRPYAVENLLLTLKSEAINADVAYDFVFMLNNSSMQFNKDWELKDINAVKTLDILFESFIDDIILKQSEA